MSSYNTGIASEYLILSSLYRLGVDAFMTLGNRKSVDITICNNGKYISLDVKAVKGYSSLIVNNMHYNKDHYVAFVIYNEKFTDLAYMPEIYIANSLDIKDIVDNYNGQLRVSKSKIAKFRDNWNILKDF